MHHLFVLVVIATLAGSASADVIRCSDAAGKISYTDGACAAGSRRVGKVEILEAAPLTPQEREQQRQAQIDRADALQRDAAAAALRQPAPSGPVEIDSRVNRADRAKRPNDANDTRGMEHPGDARWSDRRDVAPYDDGLGYDSHPRAAYRALPPRVTCGRSCAIAGPPAVLIRKATRTTARASSIAIAASTARRVARSGRRRCAGECLAGWQVVELPSLALLLATTWHAAPSYNCVYAAALS